MASKSKLKSLKSPTDFARLKAQGKNISPAAWMLVSYRENELGHLRCGWTIPSYVGSAVVRNRLKRWGREFFRTCRDQGSGLDVNVVLRRRNREFYQSLSHTEFDGALARAMDRLHAKSSA